MRMVIADSNQLIRAGLSALLKNHHEFELTGEASDENQLLELIRNFRPEVILLDFAARGFSIDTVLRCLKVNPDLKIIAITVEQSGVTIVNALRAGVSSYIKKDCDMQEILECVRETSNGGRFFCGQILQALREEAIEVNDLEMVDFNCEAIAISDRELEVIKWIAEGYTNNEIAERLFLSPHTVNTHRKNIMQKLGVNNTAAIVMYAVKTRLVSPNKFLFSPTLQ